MYKLVFSVYNQTLCALLYNQTLCNAVYTFGIQTAFVVVFVTLFKVLMRLM